MTVTIEPLVGRIVVDGGVRPPCDAMGIGRELVLDFSEPVDPATVDLRYVETRMPE